MKTVLIVANFNRNYSKEDYGRFMQIANGLSSKYKVEIVTSDFDHLTKSAKVDPAVDWPFRITKLHEIGYPNNTCLKRFISHYLWGKEVQKYIKKNKKPDLIYCAVPSLTASYEAVRFSNRNHIPVVIDVQDLWPEAFKMALHIPVFSDLIFWPFQIIADKIYSGADEIIAVSETYLNRAMRVNHKNSEGQVVFLGSRLSDFDHYAKENHVSRKDDKIRLAYCGTLGSSYDISCVIDAISIIAQKGHPVPDFIVMGSGPRENEFKAYAKQRNVNVEFMGRLPYPQMCGLLCSCDIAVNPISTGAAQSIINKHADYAASGLPVINTQENDEYRRLVENYNMGFNCNNNDPEDMADKIIHLMDDSLLREEMGQNSRRCAEEKFNRQNTYSEITNTVDTLINHGEIV